MMIKQNLSKIKGFILSRSGCGGKTVCTFQVQVGPRHNKRGVISRGQTTGGRLCSCHRGGRCVSPPGRQNIEESS